MWINRKIRSSVIGFSILAAASAAASNPERDEFWESLAKKLAEQPESACVVETRCEFVQNRDSHYSHHEFKAMEELRKDHWESNPLDSFSESFRKAKIQKGMSLETIEEYRERKKALKKSTLMPGIREIMEKIVSVPELNSDDRETFETAVKFLDRNYLKGDELPEAILMLPEGVRLTVTIKSDPEAKAVVYTVPRDYGHSTTGGNPMSDVQLMETWITKYSEISKGVLACSAELKQLDNIPRCSEK